MKSWWQDPYLISANENINGAAGVAVHQWIRKQLEGTALSLRALQTRECRWTADTIRTVLAHLLRKGYVLEVENTSRRKRPGEMAYALRSDREPRGPESGGLTKS